MDRHVMADRGVETLTRDATAGAHPLSNTGTSLRSGWWESRWAVLAALILSTVPLWLPAFPPFVDMAGHIGRYHVALDLAHSADLQRHWSYHWALIGNLGVDLLVMPLAHLVGVIFATKLVVMMIPPLFVGGLIALSRAADGQVSPAAGLAFPLAYGFPMQFGFVNFMLAAALALLALAWWIVLGRQRRFVLRTAIFVPVSWLLWIAHSFGWGMFGLLAVAADLVEHRTAGRRLPDALLRAGVAGAALATPMIAMLTGGASGSGHLGITYDPPAKLFWLLTLLRERWQLYDMISAALLVAALVIVARERKQSAFQPLLGVLAIVAGLTFLALPRLLLGGAYVDARILGIALALALVAIRFRPGFETQARAMALFAAAFFVMRMATGTVALALFARGQAQALEVVDHIPRGAAVLVMIDEPCGTSWRSDRLEHVDGIALARRDIFDNAQWALAGQQLIAPLHPEAAPYLGDPSQLVYLPECQYKATRLDEAIRDFDRGTFDYVWTMDFPAGAARARDMRLIWANRRSALYRVMR